ncbi:MAG: hypothetical protein AAF725_11455 [Acidobacteriota bacterium]
MAGPFFVAFLAGASGESQADVYVDSPVDPSAAEYGWQWIGVRLDSTVGCPSVLGTPWQVSELFPGSSGAPLNTFCRYRYIGSGLPDPGPVLALVPGSLESVTADRMVVHGLGSLGGGLANHLASLFDRHAGRIHLPVDSSAARPRLSILDTSPTTGMNPQALPDHSPHGRTLQRFAEHLLCTSGPQACVADINSRLTLGYRNFSSEGPGKRDAVQGGFYGTISDLALAIWEEVVLAGKQDVRLVLNLSVGWDPIYGGLEIEPIDMPEDVRAVYHALLEAACSGAVVIAAAGNRTDQHRPHSGPLLPAAWAERMDSSGACRASGGSSKRRLLYSVGGVQASGEPLANARPGSASRLAAYADHATVSSGVDGSPELPLTGSSVAALVASATAAAVLHYRPSLGVEAVMDGLYYSGDSLSRTAEVCQGATCDVRYISLCEAVTDACSSFVLEHCPTSLPACFARPLGPALIDNPLSLLGSSPDHWVDVSAFVPTPLQDVCGSHQPSAGAGLEPTEPCPHRQRRGFGRQPWTQPQPSSDPCPNCTLFPGSGGMALEIDPSFAGMVSNATLVTCPDSQNPSAYSLGPLELEAGDQVWVQGLPTPSCGSAFLSFTVHEADHTTSALAPVLIAKP